MSSAHPEVIESQDEVQMLIAPFNLSPTLDFEQRKSLSPAKMQTMAERYQPLAKSLAKPMAEAFPHLADEFYSASYFGLATAVKDFDPSLNIQFSTFVRSRVAAEFKEVLRTETPRGYRLNPSSAPKIRSLSSDDSKRCGRLKYERGSESASSTEEVDSMDTVEGYLRKLPAKLAEPCRLIFVEGKSLNEAAKYLSCSKNHIGNLKKKAIDALRDNATGGSYSAI